jgi:hypothetical protein
VACDAAVPGLAGDGGPPAEAGVPLDGGDPALDAHGSGYSFVVLPDTQYYASSWPDIFAAQTRWIVENRRTLGIAFVLHTGDIVDEDLPAQWMPATASLQVLDGELPYVVTAGNHDYLNLADRTGLINSYLPPSRFTATPWFGATFEPGHVENNFSLIVAGPSRWLVLALEFGPRDEVLVWARDVLTLFADTPAIVITHAYLSRDGTRYDHAGGRPQQFNPHDYVMMGQPGTSINDGEEIWRKIVEPSRNVKLVFSGHDVDVYGDIPPGAVARLTSTRADGTRVHQVLANYQSCTGPPCERNLVGTAVHGGNGYLRLLQVSPDGHTVSVSTYSPYLDRSLVDPGNQFTLELD